MSPPQTLDEAWAEAEAALPEPPARLRRGIHRLGGQLEVNRRVMPRHRNDLYAARAYSRGSQFLANGHGPTPAAALHELAAKLRATRP